MRRKSSLLLVCSALGVALLLQAPFPGPTQAQAQTQASVELDPKNPTVQSVWRVRYGDAPAKFVLIRAASGIWEESQEDVPNKWQPGRLQDVYVTSYIQTGEDATSIELLDLNRDVKMTIDLANRTVSSTGAGGSAAVVRKITDMRGLSVGPAYPAAPKFDVANWVYQPSIGSKAGQNFVIPIRSGPASISVSASDRIQGLSIGYTGTPGLKADTVGSTSSLRGEFKLQPSEQITGLSGTYDEGGSVKSLVITTITRQSQIFGVADGEMQFRLQVPRGHRLVAVTGRTDGALSALGIVTAPAIAPSAKAPDAFPFAGAEPELPVKKFEGIWATEGELQEALPKNVGIKPMKSGQVLNGTWVPKDYYVIRRVDTDPSGKTVEVTKSTAPTEVGVYVSATDDLYRAQKPLNGIRSFTWSPSESNKARIRLADGTMLSRPKVSDQELAKTVDATKVSMEDAWLVDKIPLGLLFNFAGYDITEINPFNLMKHFKAPVFAPGATTGYEFKDRKIVPHGLQFIKRDLNEYFYSESAISNEKEMQQATSFAIGLNVAAKGKGDPPSDKPKAAAGINYAKSEMSGTSENKNMMRAFGFAQIHDYVLILDQAHMKLSVGFLDIIADIKANRRPVSDLFKVYGTHYPHAVTYGAAGRTSMRFDASDVRSWAENTESVNASITIPVKAMEITPSIEMRTENKESMRMASSNKVERFSGVGGNASSNINAFQADANRVVPVLFDLRPIYELINPIYFDDPEVLGRVRTEIVKEWDARFAGISLSDDRSLEPKVYEYKIQGLRCANRKADTMDMFGKIEFTFPDEQGPRVVDLLAGSTKTSTRRIDCAAGTIAPGTEFATITIVGQRDDGEPKFSVSNLYEADLGDPWDPHDRYVLQKTQFEGEDATGASVYGVFFGPAKTALRSPITTDTNSRTELYLRYTVQELKLP